MDTSAIGGAGRRAARAARLAGLFVATAVAVQATGTAARAQVPAWPEGDVRFYNVADSDFDPHLAGASEKERRWMSEHYARMQAYTPRFDEELWWYDGAWVYKNAYGLKPDWPVVAQHPDWILRDAQGNALYVPWGCKGGTCPQFAGDFGNPAYRDWWIGEARRVVKAGYRGIWIDDVNMTWRVGDGFGNHVTPIDPRTGAPMTLDDWRRYMAEFIEEVRAALPEAELAHNVVWYAAPTSDVHQVRQILAADWINLERGVNDNGLKGGSGTYGLETFLAFVDFVHARGRPVVFMDYGTTAAAREYGLAGWFLIGSGRDLMCSNQLAWTAPGQFWHGYELRLGKALGQRAAWQNVLRRDFRHGIVLLNQPDMPTRTVQLPGPFVDLAGNTVTSVTLGPKRAAVLLRK